MLAAPARKDSAHTAPTFYYFGALTLLVYLSGPTGFLVDIQTSYLLKNQVHATATQISMLRLLTAIPVYFAFVFGLARDHWNPFGLRDRGFFLIFAPISALAFIWMAVSHTSYRGLLIGMLMAMLSSRFIVAAYQGLIALVGQQKLMSGRLSVLWNAVAALPMVAGAFASGYISGHMASNEAYFLAAASTLCIGLLALWKPRSVFCPSYDRRQAGNSSIWENVRRLLMHRAVYPAVLICFLWNFSPGGATPLQFYLTDRLHASDTIYSYYNGIFTASFIPTFLLYGFLCKRVPLRKLLWWGTLVAIPQMIPLALIHSANLALIWGVPIGLLGGVATAAYFDLAMRSCPAGLHGTLMMLVDGVFILSARGGDLLGSRIYSSNPVHGFLYCVIATTVVYTLILPLILLVPKEMIATTDGDQRPPTGEMPDDPGAMAVNK
jgi:hypothetical protein